MQHTMHFQYTHRNTTYNYAVALAISLLDANLTPAEAMTDTISYCQWYSAECIQTVRLVDFFAAFADAGELSAVPEAEKLATAIRDIWKPPALSAVQLTLRDTLLKDIERDLIAQWSDAHQHGPESFDRVPQNGVSVTRDPHAVHPLYYCGGQAITNGDLFKLQREGKQITIGARIDVFRQIVYKLWFWKPSWRYEDKITFDTLSTPANKLQRLNHHDGIQQAGRIIIVELCNYAGETMNNSAELAYDCIQNMYRIHHHGKTYAHLHVDPDSGWLVLTYSRNGKGRVVQFNEATGTATIIQRDDLNVSTLRQETNLWNMEPVYPRMPNGQCTKSFLHNGKPYGRRSQVKTIIEFGFDMKFTEHLHNGQLPSFSVTSHTVSPKNESDWLEGGCNHDLVQKLSKEIGALTRWHLVDSLGYPMHYYANGKYWYESAFDIGTYRDGDMEKSRRIVRNHLNIGLLDGDEALITDLLSAYQPAKFMQVLRQRVAPIRKLMFDDLMAYGLLPIR